MAVEKERKALDNAVTAWRRIVAHERQSIRRPQQPLAAPAQEEETESEAHPPSE